MNERDDLFLGHVLDAAVDIEAFTAEGRQAFMADRKTQSAVIRQLEIIGEAVKNLSVALTQSEPAIPWRQIAGARDRLIHAYFSVDLDAVWSMVEQDLPALRDGIQRLRDTAPKP
ncbi:MAG: DUF86 domain-containing protein [Burkholderiales bacterium]|nr:DUF86 domain-containing protein [Burkholderiales bacterium]MDE2299595.1 DUF86 domain-containing protein [Burkholderiales bacterium]MDE2627000.1 DUF86 domain-containing protein [Burkholderiales bacterium]